MQPAVEDACSDQGDKPASPKASTTELTAAEQALTQQLSVYVMLICFDSAWMVSFVLLFIMTYQSLSLTKVSCIISCHTFSN